MTARAAKMRREVGRHQLSVGEQDLNPGARGRAESAITAAHALDNSAGLPEIKDASSRRTEIQRLVPGQPELVSLAQAEPVTVHGGDERATRHHPLAFLGAYPAWADGRRVQVTPMPRLPAVTRYSAAMEAAIRQADGAVNSH